MFPTRSQAKAAVEGGKVEINGARAKPHREVKAGDRLTITTSRGDPRILVVRGLAERSIPKARARELYQDVSPPPSPQVVEARRLDRLLAPRADAGRPDRREQRERRDRKRYTGE